MTISSPRKSMVFAPRSLGEVHASTVLRLPDGSFLVAWFGGTKEGHNDVSIWGCRGDGKEWGDPQCWAKVCDLAHWNPVLYQSPDGLATLFFKVGDDCAQWTTYACCSLDSGTSWSRPEVLVPGDTWGRGPVKNKPISLHDGTLLAPASREDGGAWRVFTDISHDYGHSWTASEEAPMDREEIKGQGVIQPTLWESSPGKVHMLARSSCGWICRGDSEDGGATWSCLRKTSLPNNNSGIDLDKDSRGRLLLAFNPVGEDWGPRTPLSLAMSIDNGESWSRILDIETEAGEYSYPAVVATPEGFAGTYTWKRESIVFWEVQSDD